MKVLNSNTPDKPHYRFENTMYLGDDFGNKGRLSFETTRDEIKKLIVLFKCNKNTPKKDMRIGIISVDNTLHPGLELKTISNLKTAKKVKVNVDETIKVDAFHLPLFIQNLQSTSIKFLYESKEYIEKQSEINQEKEPLFNPKPKIHDRSKTQFSRRNRKYGE